MRAQVYSFPIKPSSICPFFVPVYLSLNFRTHYSLIHYDQTSIIQIICHNHNRVCRITYYWEWMSAFSSEFASNCLSNIDIQEWCKRFRNGIDSDKITERLSRKKIRFHTILVDRHLAILDLERSQNLSQKSWCKIENILFRSHANFTYRGNATEESTSKLKSK